MNQYGGRRKRPKQTDPARMSTLGSLRRMFGGTSAFASWQQTFTIDRLNWSRVARLLAGMLIFTKWIISVLWFRDWLLRELSVIDLHYAMVFVRREYECLRMVFSVPMSTLRRRGCILVLSCLVLIPFFGVVLFSAPGNSFLTNVTHFMSILLKPAKYQRG